MVWNIATLPFTLKSWDQVQYIDTLKKFVIIGSDNNNDCFLTTTFDCSSFSPLQKVATNVSLNQNDAYMFATDGVKIQLIQQGLTNKIFSANVNDLSNWSETTITADVINSIGYGTNISGNPVFIISGFFSGSYYFYYSTDSGSTWNKYVGVQAFKLKNCVKAKKVEDEVVYYHIMLEDKSEGLIVNNLPVESCIDDI